jgi:methylglyoxal synthase
MPFLEQHEVVTTEGCFREFLRASLFWNHKHFESVGPGYQGALVRIASGVVPGAPSEIDIVIYLIDPRDPSSNFPETNALKRECVVHKKTFLATSRSARLWAVLRWMLDSRDSLERFTVAIENIHEDLRDILCLPLKRHTVALIAHDDKKKEILEFVRDNFDFLLAFGDRVGTGTTGSLLNGLRPERLTDEKWEEVRPLCDELLAKIAAAKPTLGGRSFVKPLKSGPDGGDVQIAEMVLNRRCRAIIFFEDPSIARQHEQDIQLLERTGRTRGKDVVCIHDPRTARETARLWSAYSNEFNSEPLHVATALQRRFNVKAVVVDSNGNTWKHLREAAAWYLLAQIASQAPDRKRSGDVLRVTVSWGVGLAQIAEELTHIYSKLQARDELEANRRRKKNVAPLPLELADSRHCRPGNVIFGPMQGVVAAADDAVEANAIACQLASFFNGDAVELALAALMAHRSTTGLGKRRTVPEGIMRHWDLTDILVTTCAPVRKEYPENVPTPEFEGHYAQVKSKACGDLGGIYLTREGVEYRSETFERIGMSFSQVLRVRERGGQSILLVGAQPERDEIAFTTLETGLMSVLITDLAFAKRLLAR